MASVIGLATSLLNLVPRTKAKFYSVDQEVQPFASFFLTGTETPTF